MKARELIHALTAEWIDLDREVHLYLFDNEGKWYTGTISEVTSRAGRIDLDTAPIAEAAGG